MAPDSLDLHSTGEPRRSTGLKLIAFLCAVLVSAALLAGYAFLRKRHAETVAVTANEKTDSPPKGPAQAQITVDQPLLKSGETIIGGRVKNISGSTLSGLTVHLELRQRKDGSLVESSVSLEPDTIEPNQEASYAVKMRASEYSSVRLIGLTGNPEATRIAYTSVQGKQRPPERFEPKTIVITKRPGKGDDFLNTPDNPARVP